MKHDSPIDLVSLEPATARSIPDRPVVEKISVLSVLIDDLLFGSNALDIFFLDVLDHLHDVLDEEVNHRHGTSLAKGSVRSVYSHIIGHLGSCNT